MNIKVVRIGNSRGIRIPRKILDRCNIEEQVDLSVKSGNIILTPIRQEPRKGWELAARKMAEDSNDELLIPDVFDEEDPLEW